MASPGVQEGQDPHQVSLLNWKVTNDLVKKSRDKSQSRELDSLVGGEDRLQQVWLACSRSLSIKGSQ